MKVQGEQKFFIGIASVLGLRQIAMIIVIPLLSIYATSFPGSTPFKAGLAIGIFGLFQGIFQIPYGLLGDKYGRKPIVIIGLLQLLIGLILAGFANSVEMLIVARALQGSGAIMSTSYAWVSDYVPEERRNRGMSIIGMAMGIAAVLGFIGGPILNKWLNVGDIFFVCAGLTAVSLIFIIFAIPHVSPKKREKISNKLSFAEIFKNKRLLSFFSAGFLCNYAMVSVFFIVPLYLNNTDYYNNSWLIYTISTLAGITFMRIGTKYADNGGSKLIINLSLLGIILSSLFLLDTHIALVTLGTLLLMCGYMGLVTVLPAELSKIAPKNFTGAVTGIFNTSQNIGSFIGSALTGLLWGYNQILPMIVLVVLVVLQIIFSNTLEYKKFKQIQNRGL